MRVEADPVVIVRERADQSVTQIITQWSQDADLTLLGMDDPTPENAEEYSNRLDQFIAAVGATLLVRSGHHEELLKTDE